MTARELNRLSQFVDEGRVLAAERPTSDDFTSGNSGTPESEAECLRWFTEVGDWIERAFKTDSRAASRFRRLRKVYGFRNYLGTRQGEVEFLREDVLKMTAYLEALRPRLRAGSPPISSKVPLELLHPKVRDASAGLFEHGHYAEAIFAAFRLVNNEVKAKAPGLDLDGTPLMSEAFRKTNPRIKLTPCRTHTEQTEQEGFMHIFMGVMLGIRDPKAHEAIDQRDPVKTFEYLCLASLLLRRLEDAVPS